jgi:transposase
MSLRKVNILLLRKSPGMVFTKKQVGFPLQHFQLLSQKEISDLKWRHRNSDRRTADKIKTILMLDKGFSFEEIASVLILDDATIRRWFKVYQEQGLDGLARSLYQGSNGKLTPEQKAALCKHLEETVYMTAKEICNYVENRFGISFTSKGVTNLLHRLGFTYRKAKHVPGKADPKAQEAFLETYHNIKENKSANDRIWFVDGVHPLHNSQPAYGWLKKGYDYTLESNTGRQRININGAYNLEEHKVLNEESNWINAQSTIELFNKIEKEQPNGRIYLVLDNARYYRSQLIQDFVRDHPRIVLLFIPPYSPNLNVIERLWRFFKKKTLYNTYYEQFSHFRRSCLNYFKNIEIYQSELRTLMTDKFQIIQV